MQNRNRRAIFAAFTRQTEGQVSVYAIESGALQGLSLPLIEKADASTFLPAKINHNAALRVFGNLV